MKNVWFIHCHRTNRIGIYVVQLTWFVWVFSIRLPQSYHISDRYIIFFFLGSWEEAENRFFLFPTKPSLGASVCNLWTYASMSFVERIFAWMCPECGVICVCVVFWAPVRAYVYVKCSCICSTMSLWCGGVGGGDRTPATDIIHQLYVIPIQRSLMSQPFSWQYRAGSWACLSSWEELRCFPCPRFHVFSIMFTCVFASVAF